MESSFQIAICECPDINASTMAVDSTGRYAIISGRKSIVLIDLEGDSDVSQDHAVQLKNGLNSSSRGAPVSKRLARNTKYEPTACQFNRHMVDLFAITSNQIVEVFSIEDLNVTQPKLLLRGHSRAIADLEWSHFDPNLLGSSAADCLTNLWDVRDHRRPSASLTSVSGATQVRFSKTSSNLIATSHEIDVRIWDIRQPNLPLYYIAAHLQKINGMDWNPSKTSCDHEQLITCSQDNSIKLWDLNSNKIKPSANLQTRTPAWRIRYTPISSNAILTSTLPQLRSRAECMSLKLWSMRPNRFEQKKLELMLALVGHTDVIVDFDWRARPNDSGCEIVSWSKDQTLRVWRIDQQFIEMNVDNSDFETECETQEMASVSNQSESFVSNNLDGSVNHTINNSNREASDTPVDVTTIAPKPIKDASEAMEPESDIDQDDPPSKNLLSINALKQEFNLINKNIPNIEFEELNSLRRVCLVTARAKNVTCRLRIALPPNYPLSECPTFTIIDSNQYGGESLNKEAKEKLLYLLNETARSQLIRSRNCLEPCLRKFIAALQKMASFNSYRRHKNPSMENDHKDDPITLSAQRDHSVPFPPTSGARFCGNLLVCFGRPIIPMTKTSAVSGDSANWLVETPRSMAQLSAQLDNMRRQGSYNLSNISISYFYYGAMRRAELQNRSGKNPTVNSRATSKYLPGKARSTSQVQSTISKNYKCGPVIVYDVSVLLGGICRELAENYVFDKDVIKMCKKNAEIAATFNRRDLVQIWSLAELSSEGVLHSYIPSKDDENPFSLMNSNSDFGDRPWTMHPFGSKLIQSLIDHYVNNCHDVQTAAMLVWTFSSPKLGRFIRNQSMKYSLCSDKGNSLYGVTSSYHTVMPTMSTYATKKANSDALSDDWNFVNGPETHLYSNSWSNSTIHEYAIESNLSNDNKDSKARNESCPRNNGFPKLNILSPERSLQNDLILHIYAEVLYRLNLLNQRAMVLKNVGTNSAYSEIFGNRQTSNEVVEDRLPNLSIQCCSQKCRNVCHSAQCPQCKKYSLYCSICRLPVRGSCSVCLKCLHGGHVNHFSTWFDSYDFCPTGCGCKCLIAR
mgnify:CR=1 FL=1